MSLIFKQYKFVIFDRWGNKLFQTENITEGWNGKNAKVGLYSWMVNVLDETESLHNITGKVLLIK